MRQDNRLRGRATEVASNRDRSGCSLRVGGPQRLGVILQKRIKISFASGQPGRAFLAFLCLLTFLDPPTKLAPSAISPLPGLFAARDFNAAEAGIIERIVGHTDQFLDRSAFGRLHTPLGPQCLEMAPPGLAHPAKEHVWPAEQERLRQRRVALRKRRQVLMHDRFEQAGDDLVHRDPGLNQAIGIRFGENAAFRANPMQRLALMGNLGERLG